MKQVYQRVCVLLVLFVTGCGSTQIGSPGTTTALPVASATVSAASPTTPPATPTLAATVAAMPTVTPQTPTTAPTATVTPPAPDGTATGEVRSDLDGKLLFMRGTDLWVYTPQDGAVRRVLQDAYEARWSPDGNQIAFVRDGSVYVANADGSAEQRVYDAKNAHAPIWAANGTRLAFEHGSVADDASVREVWVYDLDRDEARKVGDGTDPAWSPDSERIAYVTIPGEETPRRNELHIVNFSGENDSTVVGELPTDTPAIGIPDNKVEPAALEHMMQDPFWNADGNTVYVASYVSYQVLTGFSIWERADATTGGSTFLGELPEVMGTTPAPNRKAALFSVSSARGDTWFVARGVETDDTDWAWAETSNGVSADAPAWSPDSTAVAYYQCSLEQAEDCNLRVRDAEGEDVVIDNVFGEDGPDRSRALTLDWTR